MNVILPKMWHYGSSINNNYYYYSIIIITLLKILILYIYQGVNKIVKYNAKVNAIWS